MFHAIIPDFESMFPMKMKKREVGGDRYIFSTHQGGD